jgi:Dehydrogenases with different specificities (related to short-chain alcohol dehydrogenases)
MKEQKKEVVVLVGTGSIGQAIARRIGAGKHLVLADLHQKNAEEAGKVLTDAGFVVSTTEVDISSRTSILQLIAHAQGFGEIKNLINAAGVSPSQAPVKVILSVDLYGTAVLLEEFGKVIAEDGSGIVISSQSGHRLGALSEEENMLLATTPTEDLLKIPFIEEISDTLKAYQYSKRCNGLRVMAEATNWGKRGATINAISPGVIITPLANDELNGPRGEGYRKMLSLCPAGRAGTPDEVGELAEFLMSKRGKFITGADYLIDGGTTAAYWFGDLQYLKNTH